MAELALDWGAISDTFMANRGPEILLALIGVLAIAVAILRVKDGEDGNRYRIVMLVGLLASVLMVYVLVVLGPEWSLPSLTIVAVACFALIIRPFRKIHFAVILSIMVVCLVYIYLGSVTGILEPISEDWPRIIVAFVAGGLFYAVASFAEAIIDLAGAILNFVPILFVLGIICVAEAACLIYTGDTIYQFYLAHYGSEPAMLEH